jgi:hypothetical protein
MRPWVGVLILTLIMLAVMVGMAVMATDGSIGN